MEGEGPAQKLTYSLPEKLAGARQHPASPGANQIAKPDGSQPRV